MSQKTTNSKTNRLSVEKKVRRPGATSYNSLLFPSRTVRFWIEKNFEFFVWRQASVRRDYRGQCLPTGKIFVERNFANVLLEAVKNYKDSQNL